MISGLETRLRVLGPWVGGGQALFGLAGSAAVGARTTCSEPPSWLLAHE